MKTNLYCKELDIGFKILDIEHERYHCEFKTVPDPYNFLVIGNKYALFHQKEKYFFDVILIQLELTDDSYSDTVKGFCVFEKCS
jgi:hypothetical protein